MAVTGAILGDIAGSQYEFDRPDDLDWQDCELFTEKCVFTDDTVMSLAIKSALDNGVTYQDEMQKVGRKYPLCGYGGRFFDWMFSDDPQPYGSYGNGSAMRCSYIGEFFDDLGRVREEAQKSAKISHNHPEGIKGAVVTASCVWMAKHGRSKQEIYDYVSGQYPAEGYKYSIERPLDELRPVYKWDVSCQGSVPAAMRCFYESDSYISFLRNVFSLSCDMDTLCAIGGGVAEEFYGKTGLKDEKILEHYLDEYLLSVWRE